MKRFLILFAAVLGCGSSSTVTVTPTTAEPIEDNFFVTWEIQSTAFGAVDCRVAGAATVDLDAINADTGERFVFSFPCDDYQGVSGPVSVGHFDVLLDLTDPSGFVISEVDVGTQNITTAGTIDLGHAIFVVP